jgi:hemerythrin
MKQPLLEWREEHRIGVESLDYEHQQLFRSISELADGLEQHEDEEAINGCLGDIHARMESHFALEERFMREHHYADYAGHKAKHDRFLDEICEVIAGFQRDSTVLYGRDLRLQLKEWIEGHVLNDDKKMISAVR